MSVTQRRGMSGTFARSQTPAAALEDAQFGPLVYLGGWWYGGKSFLGFEHVRLRISGSLSAPSQRALRVLRQFEADADRVRTEIDERLRKTCLGFIEADVAQMTRTIGAGRALKPCYALVAICAGATGDDDTVELAFETTRPASPLVIPYRRDALGDPRRCPSIWRTPTLAHAQ
jgi:hypothetical protein